MSTHIRTGGEISPLTERDLTSVRSVRELGAGNGPPSFFLLPE